MPLPRRRAMGEGNMLRAEASCSDPSALGDRWSLRVELRDDEIARLYSQGLARGAQVWRAGMPDWLPLLKTPELSSLLYRTRVTLTGRSDTLSDEVTLPRPARLPTEVGLPDKVPSDSRDSPTVAP